MPGDPWRTTTAYDRKTHHGLPIEHLAHGGWAFYKANGQRFRVPRTSLAWAHEDNEPAPPVNIPSRSWTLRSVYFLGTAAYVGGRHVAIESWQRDKHGADIRCVELSDGSVQLITDGTICTVPVHSIGWYVDDPVETPPEPEVEKIESGDAWPVHEVTPALPPKRTPRAR
jgi:hypothetical protein